MEDNSHNISDNIPNTWHSVDYIGHNIGNVEDTKSSGIFLACPKMDPKMQNFDKIIYFIDINITFYRTFVLKAQKSQKYLTQSIEIPRRQRLSLTGSQRWPD